MTTPTKTDVAKQIKLAAEAFIYGYPLVYNMHECEKFGLTAAESSYVDSDPGLAKILAAGVHAAQEKLEELIKNAAKPVDGWQNVLHVFDYNLDFLQSVYVDIENQPLSSEYRYEMHMPVPPPVDAFWSLTMYDAHEFYLVDNPIRRYSIGDRTPGLKYGDDGSLTIYIQKESPGADKETNWLPSPQSGGFRPLMRMYQPKQPILDASYHLPGIRCVG